jgi:hypothetical protein
VRPCGPARGSGNDYDDLEWDVVTVTPFGTDARQSGRVARVGYRPDETETESRDTREGAGDHGMGMGWGMGRHGAPPTVRTAREVKNVLGLLQSRQHYYPDTDPGSPGRRQVYPSRRRRERR